MSGPVGLAASTRMATANGAAVAPDAGGVCAWVGQDVPAIAMRDGGEQGSAELVGSVAHDGLGRRVRRGSRGGGVGGRQ